MAEINENGQNTFLTLLDIYFDDDEIKNAISEYLSIVKGVSKWMLYSDYCLDDKSKPNDVISFALMPFKSEEHYLEMQASIKSLQPTDIKKTRHINPEFLKLLKEEPVFMFSFILDERKEFFGSTHSQRVSNIKDSLEMVRDCYSVWGKNAENIDVSLYYENIVKTISSKVAYLNQSKNPNIKLLSDIFIISFIGAYISYRVLENAKVDTFGWFSDRDNIISGVDNIIVSIFNYYLHNLWHGEKQYQFCSMTPDSSIGLFYEEFNRIVDVVTGALADYDMAANTISADKFDTVLTEYIAENTRLFVFKFYKDGDNLRLAREVVMKKS